MVQLYHNRNVNKNSLLFKVDYTSRYPTLLLPFLISLFSDAQHAYHLAGIFWQRVCVSARWYAAIGSRLLIQAFTYQ